jgi:hypothetical protein
MFLYTVYLFPVMLGHRVLYMSIVEYTVSENKKRHNKKHTGSYWVQNVRFFTIKTWPISKITGYLPKCAAFRLNGQFFFD